MKVGFRDNARLLGFGHSSKLDDVRAKAGKLSRRRINSRPKRFAAGPNRHPKGAAPEGGGGYHGRHSRRSSVG